MKYLVFKSHLFKTFQRGLRREVCGCRNYLRFTFDIDSKQLNDLGYAVLCIALKSCLLMSYLLFCSVINASISDREVWSEGEIKELYKRR